MQEFPEIYSMKYIFCWEIFFVFFSQNKTCMKFSFIFNFKKLRYRMVFFYRQNELCFEQIRYDALEYINFGELSEAHCTF